MPAASAAAAPAAGDLDSPDAVTNPHPPPTVPEEHWLNGTSQRMEGSNWFSLHAVKRFTPEHLQRVLEPLHIKQILAQRRSRRGDAAAPTDGEEGGAPKGDEPDDDDDGERHRPLARRRARRQAQSLWRLVQRERHTRRLELAAVLVALGVWIGGCTTVMACTAKRRRAFEDKVRRAKQAEAAQQQGEQPEQDYPIDQ